MEKQIVVIGGGAAGFFAAIQAARANPSANVSLFEASRKPLAKVLISGGGRCNTTNHTLDIGELVKQYPRGSRELRAAFSRFAVADTIDWFAAENVTLKTEPDNRMFPTTDSSETIARCLITAARRANVSLFTEKKVQRITVSAQKKFDIYCKDSPVQQFDHVILTTGGSKQGFLLAAELGHTIVSPVPSLFTFQITDPLIEDLAGLSFPDAQLALRVQNHNFKWRGPILITHWGLSGPAIIKLSAIAARELFNSDYHAQLEIAFDGEVSADAILEKLQAARQAMGKKLISSSPLIEVPKRFWQRAVALSGISSEKNIADCTKAEFQKLANFLGSHPLQVTGKGVFKEEFVTCGGVLLKEVDFKTMQSKKVPGLSFAGEILDIDGITGGFNFQSAWTTGWIAGSNC